MVSLNVSRTIIPISLVRRRIGIFNKKTLIMNPHIYIGLPALVRLQYLKKSQNLILEVVAKVTDVSVDDITGTSRVKRCAIARHYAVHFLRKYAHMHLKTIGEVLGNRNHSTILWSLETFNNSLIYPDFKFTADLIEERILALNQSTL